MAAVGSVGWEERVSRVTGDSAKSSPKSGLVDPRVRDMLGAPGPKGEIAGSNFRCSAHTGPPILTTYARDRESICTYVCVCTCVYMYV